MAGVSGRGSLGEARGQRDDLCARLIDGLAGAAEATDLDVEELHLAEELARVLWSMGDRQRQSLVFLVVAALAATRSGSTRLPLGGGTSGYLGRLIRELATAAGIDQTTLATLADIAELCRARDLDRVIGGPGERLPLITAHGCLYLHRHFTSEGRVVEAVRRLCDAGDRLPKAQIESAVADIMARPSARSGQPVLLSGEQRASIESAARSPLWVVSGGPGTGKTSIVVSILRVLVRSGIAGRDLALAAPTGKAAQRLHESIAAHLAGIANPSAEDEALATAPPQPQTIHRLLRYSPRTGRFGFHRNRALPARVIIVDEASMIDLELLDGLLAAIGPEASLILLGDADQLPSVEAGAVLRELVLAGAASPRAGASAFSTRLTRSYRMSESDGGGSAILAAADAVRSGKLRGLCGARGAFSTSSRLEDLQQAGAELLESEASPRTLARWWHNRLTGAAPSFASTAGRVYQLAEGRFSATDDIAIDSLFAAFARRRLMTALRRGESGCESINAALHAEVLATTALAAGAAFYPGEPVLVRQNDYSRQLFNGEQGVILRVADEGQKGHSFRAVFRDPAGGYRALSIDALRGALDLAYAITVHQAQGSEADEVLLILPDTDRPLLSRELVYTAITRARRWALVAGTAAILRAAVGRPTERFSGIAAGLGESP